MDTPKPTYGISDLSSILVSKEDIASRVAELGKDLNEFYGNQHVTVICILSGALLFTSDILRHLTFPTQLDCLRAESYGNNTESASKPRITNPLKNTVEGKHVLVIDDILDSGKTLKSISEYLKQANPLSVKTCVMLDKKERRETEIAADFVGFDIPNAFAVGYGLDFAEHYRNLSSIGVLKEEFQVAPKD
ncbi:hypoxanthine phosphoribosyltransferase [Puniceicoccaceae bacterium K14]|nr:hypoxanthine phosphoribosyltransferase [Puniceicoccaceae bacterium K14]